MKKIVVTGSDGQLGSELKYLSATSHDEFFFENRTSLDITDSSAVEHYFSKQEYDICINAAAYTAVDKAEDEVMLAKSINVIGVANLAKACNDNNVVLIHLSTDFVFDGEAKEPYDEFSKTNPLSVYGKTKLQGEKIAMDINPDTFVIRTSWVYSSFGKNFVKTMLKLGSERSELNVVNDQFGSPTYARDLAGIVLKLIDDQISADFGIYNYSNDGIASWYDFASEIMKQANINCKVNPIPTSQFPTSATRPSYSVLDKTKVKNALNVRIPDWQDSLRECLRHLKEIS